VQSHKLFLSSGPELAARLDDEGEFRLADENYKGRDGYGLVSHSILPQVKQRALLKRGRRSPYAVRKDLKYNGRTQIYID
jgi:hypothetical protein